LRTEELAMEMFVHALVAVDPSEADGESSLSLARQVLDAGGLVTVVVFRSGDEGAPLRSFAAVEEVTLIKASEIYLGQVAERLASGRVTTTSLEGDDLAADLLTTIAEVGASVVVIPATVAGRHVAAVGRLVGEVTVPVVITPGSRAAE
jgi:hypothetical protein